MNLVAYSWVSEDKIPEEAFDQDKDIYDLLLILEEEAEEKALFIDRNIVIHEGGLYEGLFKLEHFERIKPIFINMEKQRLMKNKTDKKAMKDLLKLTFGDKCKYEIDENCVYLYDNDLTENAEFQDFQNSCNFKVVKSLFDDKT